MLICKDHAIQQEAAPYLAQRRNGREAILTAEYGSGKEFLKNCPKNRYSFGFYYGKRIWDMEREGDILKLQKELVDRKDYKTAKVYNEFQIMVSRLNGHKDWLFYPKEIQLEHTNRCNARCIMCGHWNADKRKCRDLPKETFQRIIPFLPFCRHVGLHGYGEPFLAKHILDCLQVYQAYGVRLYANSNLSYVPEELLPYIGEMFDEINVSCESVRKEDYERIRQGLRFCDFVENVEKIRKECPKVRLNLFAVIMRQNLEQLTELVEFAAEHGFAKVSMTEMIAMEENGNFGDVPSQYPDLLSYALKQAARRARELQIELDFPKEAVRAYEDTERDRRRLLCQPFLMGREAAPRHGASLLFDRQKITRKAEEQSIHRCEGVCDVFGSQMYCALDGKLAVCCVDGYHYTAELADIHSIKEYWQSPGVRIIRDCFERQKLPAVCNNCNFILLDRLKSLHLPDREGYLRQVNEREGHCE